MLEKASYLKKEILSSNKIIKSSKLKDLLFVVKLEW